MPLTPVYLLTGFLGSGKTTLLNALLKHPAFANTAVVVNEFGEIGLDHFLIEQSQDNVVLLEAGCLCCTISDSLHETLADLNFRKVRGELPPFERVIVETTGLADPAPILNTLIGNRLVTDHYALAATIVTVDAQHALAELEANVEVAKQIAMADRLVITKLDLVAEPKPLLDRLAALNAGAEIVRSRAGDAALEAFAPIDRHALREVPAADHHPHHHHDVNRHDAHIRAHCFIVDGAESWSGIAAWWKVLSETCGNRLLRAKGVVRVRDTGEIVFLQAVQNVFHRPERLPGWPDADTRSRLVVIARDVPQEDLERCLAALDLPAGSDPNVPLAELTSGRKPS